MNSVVRSSFAAVRTASPLLAARTPSAALAATARRNMTTFGEREKGEETVYMRKEDKKLLEKLIKKHHKEEHSAKEDLLEILGDHKLPDDVIDKLLHWKSS